MSQQLKASIQTLAQLAHATGMFAIAALTAVMVGVTTLAAVGVLPWLEFQASFGGGVYQNAGQIAQIGLTGLLMLLSIFIPSAFRVLRLENSHRRFAMSMQDVTQAYAIAHAADRAGAFTMSSEYDAVRERMMHLRNHPDLAGLEPEIIEVAAQMSQISQDLATTYSDENIDRAKSFLRERQHEIDIFNDRINHAKQVTSELKNWTSAVEIDESMAKSQLNRLRETLVEVMPELAMPDLAAVNGRSVNDRIVQMPRYAAE